MKKKKTLIQFKSFNLLLFIAILSSVIGIVLTLKNLFNFPIMLLITSFVCFIISEEEISEKEDNANTNFLKVISAFSSFLIFTIFPSVILFKSINSWIVDIIIPLFILASIINLSIYNLHIINIDHEDKEYYHGLPTKYIALVYPFIYLVTYNKHALYVNLIVPIIILFSIFEVINIKIKKPNTKKFLDYFQKTTNKKVVKVIFNFIIFPIFLTLISDLFFKVNAFDGLALLDTFKVPINYPMPFILVSLLFSLLTLIFTGIFKKTNYAKAVMMVILTVFLTINDCKYIIMNRPVVLSDVNFLNASNMEMSALFMNTIKGIWVLKVLVKVIIFFVLTVFIYRSKLFLEEFTRKISRLEVIGVSILIFGLFIYFTVKNSFYMVTKTYNVPLEEIYKIEDYAEVYYNQGLFQGILFNTYSSSIFKPTNYNKENVKKLLDSTKIEEENWGKPNIVIILSESFFDLSNIDEISFDKDLTPNIHRFEKEEDKLVTNTYVSVFGGSSVVSEWEILTGGTNQFNVSTYIPYTDYYLKKNKKNVDKSPHIIKSLNKEGYITKYITPWDGASYNSEEVYKMVGTDKMVYNLKGDKKGLWLSDEAINENIISELNKDKGTPKLLIYATSQNHMPCEENRYKDYDIDVTSSTFNEDDTALIKCYAQGVYDADKALGNLCNKINELDEDTIVIFYGDHLPFINNKTGSNSIKSSSYLNNIDKSIENLHNYTTKGVIISNYIKKQDKSINYINLNYLSSYVYAHLDIMDKEYYNFVNNTRKSIPVFSRRYIYNPITKITTDLGNLSKKDKETLENLRFVQYYEFFDK